MKTLTGWGESMRADTGSGLGGAAMRAAFCLLCLCWPLAGAAVPVAYDFTATVDTITDPGGVLAGSGLLVGSNFDGFYTVESTTIDLEPQPIAGQYDSGLLTTTLQLGVFTMVLDPGTGSTNRFWVVDEYPFGVLIDGYAPVLIGASGTLDGNALSAGEMQVYLASSNTGIFASDTMPASMPSRPIGDWDQLSSVLVSGIVGGNPFQIDATVTSFPSVPVPEPSTVLLMSLGLLGLGAVGRRR